MSTYLKGSAGARVRLFFAAPLPPEAVTAVEQLQQQFRKRVDDPGVRWVKPDQLHYTIKFLGDTLLSEVPAIVARAEAVTKWSHPIPLSLTDMGAFPNAERPSVLWLGSETGALPLEQIAVRLDSLLAGIGVQREKRTFKAHLTIARVKSYAGEQQVANLLKSSPELILPEIKLDRITLFRSDLNTHGSQYTELEVYRFPEPTEDHISL